MAKLKLGKLIHILTSSPNKLPETSAGLITAYNPAAVLLIRGLEL